MGCVGWAPCRVGRLRRRRWCRCNNVAMVDMLHLHVWVDCARDLAEKNMYTLTPAAHEKRQLMRAFHIAERRRSDTPGPATQ
eukprot:8546289-Pyramimonas_sp.AAC.3